MNREARDLRDGSRSGCKGTFPVAHFIHVCDSSRIVRLDLRDGARSERKGAFPSAHFIHFCDNFQNMKNHGDSRRCGRGLRFLLRRLPSPLLFPSLVFSVFPFRLCPATWFFSERPSKRLYPKIKEHSRLFGRMRWKGSSKQSEISQPEKGNNEKGKRRGEGRYIGKLCGYFLNVRTRKIAK